MSNLSIAPEVWLAEQFKYEYCSECGGDERHHDAVPMLGNWFARCRTALVPHGPDGTPLAWPDPQHTDGWVDAWNGWYPDFDFLMREAEFWTADPGRVVLEFGEALITEDEFEARRAAR